MPIISFWNDQERETGKTLSMVAIATYMALTHNYKILIVDTEFNSYTINDCYLNRERDNVKSEVVGPKTDISTGVEGLAKAVMSNKSSPEIITNYTKIIFKDRLEVLLGMETKDFESYTKTASVYKDILQFAKKTYDIVFVDLPNGLNDMSSDILQISDLIIINTAQNMRLIEQLVDVRKQNELLLPKEKTLINLGRYDLYSKYNTKNIARLMGEKKELLSVPYCTQFFESACEGEAADYFIKYNKIMDITDKNSIFVMAVKKSSERIIYKLQEMQLKL